jgi:GWxTD domain-containing protein
MVAAEDDESGRSYIKVGINYQLVEDYESKHILDSSSILLVDSNYRMIDSLVKVRVQYPGKGVYILKLELTDYNRIDAVSDYLVLDNTDENSRNNFIMKNDEDQLLFRKYVQAGEHFVIEYAGAPPQELLVRYYDRAFPLALPPFIEGDEQSFNYEADSIFIIPMFNGRTDHIKLVEEGFYHFQIDSNQRKGLTVFRFPGQFPAVTKPLELLGPLRYITTKKEYESIENAPDLKLAIDNYWLDVAGNPTRARAMIQKYYGRVVDANNYFTSYLEGWKTDRGLIYAVFGPPSIVYRGNGVEEWIYGEKGNANSMRLRFVKVTNPFSENDYSLIKSPSYKEKWYNIVNSWRR